MEAVNFGEKLINPKNLNKVLEETIKIPLKYEKQRIEAQKKYLFKTDGMASKSLINEIEKKLQF